MLFKTKQLCQLCLTKSLKITHLARRGRSFKSEAEEAYYVFSSTAGWYERLINFSSFGRQNPWKNELMKIIKLRKGTRLIDVAGGQGAVSIRCLKSIQENKIEDCEFTVCDINHAMIENGQKTFAALKYNPNSIRWVLGDAQKLPFPDQSFNTYVIAYGFRGICLEKTFQEAYRVLKPGSVAYCLELQNSDNFLVNRAHWFIYKYIFPTISQVMFKTREPFNYFIKMYPKLPNQEKIKTVMENSGFLQVEYKNLTWGLAAIHWGYKK